jgi:hypothetical protein
MGEGSGATLKCCLVCFSLFAGAVREQVLFTKLEFTKLEFAGSLVSVQTALALTRPASKSGDDREERASNSGVDPSTHLI